jgi:hypothetical protein
LRVFCRALDRVADVAKRPCGQSYPASELGARIGWALNHAIGNLRSVDQETFANAFPSTPSSAQTASRSTPAMLSVVDALRRLQELVRAVDPSIDEALYCDLVRLGEPVGPEPIA